MAPTTIKPAGSNVSISAPRPQPAKYETVPEGMKRGEPAKGGDNLWKLAKQYDVEPNEFAKANPKIAERANKWVYPGDEILVPVKPHKGWGSNGVKEATTQKEQSTTPANSPDAKKNEAANAKTLESQAFKGLNEENQATVRAAVKDDAKPEAVKQLVDGLGAKQANEAKKAEPQPVDEKQVDRPVGHTDGKAAERMDAVDSNLKDAAVAQSKGELEDAKASMSKAFEESQTTWTNPGNRGTAATPGTPPPFKNVEEFNKYAGEKFPALKKLESTIDKLAAIAPYVISPGQALKIEKEVAREGEAKKVLESKEVADLDPKDQAAVRDACNDKKKPMGEVKELVASLKEKLKAANAEFKEHFASLNPKNQQTIQEAGEQGKDVRAMAKTLAEEQGRADAAEIAGHHGYDSVHADSLKDDAVKFLKGDLFSSLTATQKWDTLKEFKKWHSVEDATEVAQKFALENSDAKAKAKTEEDGKDAQAAVKWMGTPEFTKMTAKDRHVGQLVLEHGATVEEAKILIKNAADPKIHANQKAAMAILKDANLAGIDTSMPPEVLSPDFARVVVSDGFRTATKGVREQALKFLSGGIPLNQVLDTLDKGPG